MTRIFKLGAACALLMTFGCNPAAPFNNATGNEGGVGETTTTDGAASDGNNGSGNETSTASFGFSGQISASPAAKRRPRAQAADNENFLVIAASNESGKVYEAATDADGKFTLELPESEKGGAFIVTIVNPDGQAEGPVLMDAAGQTGVTGVAITKATSLGIIELPEDPTRAPIRVGTDNTIGGQLAPDFQARLDANGVPVGVLSRGKGDGADGPAAGAKNPMDGDQDGLIDLYDADNDGNGIVDDFENVLDFGALPRNSGIRVNFFMNLKINEAGADVYYNGAETEIAERRKEDTVITFEVLDESASGRQITGVRLAKWPAPPYLGDMTVTRDLGTGPQTMLWGALDYAFEEAGDRWQAWAVAHKTVNAGDSFGVVIDFDDGTSLKMIRMINYVFTNIPRLMNHGAPGNLTAYAGGAVSFDGTQDVVLEFQPPVDETGAYLTGMDYFFEFFYNAAGDGAQVQQNVDWDATFGGTPPADFQNGKFVVTADELGALSGTNTYTVTLPAELFVDAIAHTDGSTTTIGNYKIDIAAQKGGNAAVMLGFQKQ